jgi:hypothetical protein
MADIDRIDPLAPFEKHLREPPVEAPTSSASPPRRKPKASSPRPASLPRANVLVEDVVDNDGCLAPTKTLAAWLSRLHHDPPARIASRARSRVARAALDQRQSRRIDAPWLRSRVIALWTVA